MRWLIATLIVIFVAVAVVVYLGWSKLPSMLSKHLTEEMSVKVSIEKIGLGLRTISVYDLVIGNVKNGILPKAFSAKEIDVHASLTEYFKEEIVVEEIVIEGIYLGLEFNNAKGTDGNWTELMKQLQSSSAGKSGEEKKRSLLVKKVVLRNIDTDLVYRDNGRVQHLPRIDHMELYNISSSGGLPVDQLMNSVLGQMLKQVFIKQNLKDMLQDLLQGKSPLNQYIPSPIKRFLPFGG